MGGAWAWGSNTLGQLGNGSTTDSHVPVAVSMPAGVGFSAVVGGAYDSLALDTGERAWDWGSNAFGQLGNGSTTDSHVPVAVSMPAGVSFRAVSGGGYHSLALDTAGHLWAWGDNDYGQLGNGSTTNSNVPVAVSMPAGVSFSAISVGFEHSLALDTTGHPWAWGNNFYGQLGNGSTTDSHVPVAVSMPGGVMFSAVSAGTYHSLALDTAGHAWAWGRNDSGQLGNGSTNNSNAPVVSAHGM